MQGVLLQYILSCVVTRLTPEGRARVLTELVVSELASAFNVDKINSLWLKACRVVDMVQAHRRRK